ncbi:MAG: hypothetical protein V1928_03675 [Parcubacteria group bacterium]
MNLEKKVCLLALLLAAIMICGCHKPGVAGPAVPPQTKMDLADRVVMAMAQHKYASFRAVTNAAGGKLVMLMNIGEREPIREKYILLVKGQQWRFVVEPAPFKKVPIKPAFAKRELTFTKKDFDQVFLTNPSLGVLINVMRVRLNDYWRRGLIVDPDICLNLSFEFFPAELYAGKGGTVYFEKHRLALINGDHWNYQYSSGHAPIK